MAGMVGRRLHHPRPDPQPLEDRPKSFWADRPDVEPSAQWVTAYDDDPVLRMEAEIIHACAIRGLDPRTADGMYLWEIAAYLGIHRLETVEEHDQREIIQAKADYWEETEETRAAKLSDYSERRRQRQLERKRA